MLSPLLRHYPTCQLSVRNVLRCHFAVLPSRRGFHASASRKHPTLDAILYLPNEMMSYMHTAIPWYATIPLTAFILRGLLVTTAGSWSRALTARYVGLHPLRQAFGVQKRDEVLRRGGFKHPKDAILAARLEVKKAVGDLDSRWNVSLKGQIGWTFGQLPIFLIMAEVIRRKCGIHDGLLGWTMSAISFKEPAASTSGLINAENLYFEPTLANEGMLWFQDLLLPDPYCALPFVVSALMFSNIYFTKNTVNNDAKTPIVIRRVLLGVALIVGPLTIYVPCALLLYWASSTTSVILWNFWLDWRYPAPRNFTMCQRPLLMPPKELMDSQK